MVRRPKIKFLEALYQVIVRGNRRHRILGDDTDRLKFLELLSQL